MRHGFPRNGDSPPPGQQHQSPGLTRPCQLYPPSMPPERRAPLACVLRTNGTSCTTRQHTYSANSQLAYQHTVHHPPGLALLPRNSLFFLRIRAPHRLVPRRSSPPRPSPLQPAPPATASGPPHVSAAQQRTHSSSSPRNTTLQHEASCVCWSVWHVCTSRVFAESRPRPHHASTLLASACDS